MKHPSLNEKMIFGLKMKQLRTQNSLSFTQLSKRTGMSLSYLNEIEKGKKYPKPDKIKKLAKALLVAEDELVFPKLEKSWQPLQTLLKSNFLNELPLDLFGINLSKVVDIVANAPLKVGAFISTLMDISRNYAVHESHFYFGAMRAYQELHNNYFEDIEAEVDRFVHLYDISIEKPVTNITLATILEERFGYKIEEKGLVDYPELQSFRSVFIPAQKRLLLNGKMNEMQCAFQFGKELGFNFLKLKPRPNTSTVLRVGSFEEVLNNYKAIYFSVALLVNKHALVADLKYWFNQSEWRNEYLSGLLKKYKVSPETLFQRMNLLPTYFGIEKLFFIRVIHDLDSNQFEIDKELHLNGKHRPHANHAKEHYCRRWLTLTALEKLKRFQEKDMYRQPILGVQRSLYLDSKDEYLCITIARPAYPTVGKNICVTVGVKIEDSLFSKVKFAQDRHIPRRVVNVTCERCTIPNCKERAAPPTVIEQRLKRQKIQETLVKLIEEK